MRHIEETLSSTDGLELFFQSWQPDGDPRAVFAIVHGGGDHSGRYEHLVEAFLKRGYALAGVDLRGHGRSKGERGHLMDWEEIRCDMDAYLARVRQLFPNSPVFLYGHSMGELAALDYSLRRAPELSGVIVSGASVTTSGTNRLLILLSRLLSRIRPRFFVKAMPEGKVLSRANMLGGDDNELIIYEGGLHEVHNDLQREQVFADIQKWVAARL